MLKLRTTWIGLVATSILFSIASAQTAPPPAGGDKPVQDPPVKQGDPVTTPPAKTDDKEPAKEEEKKEPRVLFNVISVGYGMRDLRGIQSRLNQYASPARGLTLYELNVTSPLTEKNPFGHLTWKGTPGQDTVVEGQTAFDFGRIYLRGIVTRYGYSEPEWQPHAQSHYESNDYNAHLALGPDAGLYYRYWSERRSRGFISPNDPTNYLAQTNALGLEGRILGGQAGVTVSDVRFYDRTGQQPNSLRSTVTGHYTLPIGPTVTLNGLASYTKIAQSGMVSSSIRHMAFSGLWDLVPTTTLSVFLSQDDIDLRNIQNAYAKKRLISSARLDQAWRGGGAEFSFVHREDERLRSDHSYVDVPKWNTFEGKFWHRISPQLRFITKGTIQNLNSAPTMNTEDPRQLYWSFKSDIQARIEGGNEKTAFYAGYRSRFRENRGRDFNVAWSNWSIGGSHQFNPKLSGYAEVSYDKFNARGVDPDTGDHLSQYFPDNLSETAGLEWTRKPGEVFTGALNYSVSGIARLTQVTFTYHRDIARDKSLELVVASPWRYEDRQYQIAGYRADIFQVRYITRF